METVLGLSMTSNSIGWVLLDGTGADAETLDHDHFDLISDAAIDGDIARHEAAVRGAQAIAAASGHQVKTIALTWSDDVAAKAALLRKSLPDMGFETVVAVPMPEAARSWAQAFHRTLGFDRCAVCVVESSAVTVVSVLYDTVRTAKTRMRESADGLGRWLSDVLESNRAQPESLYILGPRGDLELIAGPLDDALSMPVIASDEAQLTLARGAALNLGAASRPAPEVHPAVPTAATRPARARQYRFGSHARAATVLVAGVVALFAVGPELAGLSGSGAAERRPAVESSDASAASNPSTTSVSVHAVPSPVAPPVAPTPQPLVAVSGPVPAPAPPEAVPTVATAVAPAVPVETAAEPVVAAVAEPQEPTETVQETIEAEPAVAPPAPVVAQPVAAPPAPQAPPAQPAVAVAPAPSPVAAPMPPPDPISAALSPLFGALP